MHNRIETDELFEQALDEIESGKYDKATYARSLVDAGGDEAKVKERYIRLRVDGLNESPGKEKPGGLSAQREGTIPASLPSENQDREKDQEISVAQGSTSKHDSQTIDSNGNYDYRQTSRELNSARTKAFLAATLLLGLLMAFIFAPKEHPEPEIQTASSRTPASQQYIDDAPRWIRGFEYPPEKAEWTEAWLAAEAALEQGEVELIMFDHRTFQTFAEAKAVAINTYYQRPTFSNYEVQRLERDQNWWIRESNSAIELYINIPNGDQPLKGLIFETLPGPCADRASLPKQYHAIYLQRELKVSETAVAAGNVELPLDTRCGNILLAW